MNKLTRMALEVRLRYFRLLGNDHKNYVQALFCEMDVFLDVVVLSLLGYHPSTSKPIKSPWGVVCNTSGTRRWVPLSGSFKATYKGSYKEQCRAAEHV